MKQYKIGACLHRELITQAYVWNGYEYLWIFPSVHLKQYAKKLETQSLRYKIKLVIQKNLEVP